MDGKLPAFPGTRENGLYPPSPGIDVRTYIATQMMAAFIARPPDNLALDTDDPDQIETIAQVAVDAANALLLALDRAR